MIVLVPLSPMVPAIVSNAPAVGVTKVGILDVNRLVVDGAPEQIDQVQRAAAAQGWSGTVEELEPGKRRLTLIFHREGGSDPQSSSRSA